MRRIVMSFGIIALFSLFVACGRPESSQAPVARFDPSRSDPQAIALVDQMMAAIDPGHAFASAKYLAFHFVVLKGDTVVVNRAHEWNRYSDDYRLEWTDRDSSHFAIYMNMQSRSGNCFVNDEAVTDSAQINTLLTKGYAIFINDTYWLLAPLKLKDSGVILKYNGTVASGNETYEVVNASFDHVGLTPENRYNFYIDQVQHLVRKWDHFRDANAEPRTSIWNDWRDVAGVKFSFLRNSVGSNNAVALRNIKISQEVELSRFEPPQSAEQTADK